MTKFLSKLLLFGTILFIFSLVASYTIDKGLQKTSYSYYAEWNDLYNSKINADLLILGSSRARQHFSTTILDSALNMNSYVIGIEACRFRMINDVFKLYLIHNKKPAFLILSLDGYLLHENSNSYYYQQFLPYLKDTSIRNLYTGYLHEFSIGDYYLPLYKYRGERTQIFVGIFEFFGIKKYPRDTFKGFGSYNKKWDGSYDRYVNSIKTPIEQEVDSTDVSLIKKLLVFCKTNNIKVYMVFSPEYLCGRELIINGDSIRSLYSALSSEYGASYLDFCDDSISSDKYYFYNSQHLSTIGATYFSKKLASEMSSGMHYLSKTK
jgi:hypothetical protein